MAYPPVAVTTTDKQAVQSIFASEAGILDCMAEYFGTANYGFVDTLATETDIFTRAQLLSELLCAYTNKENSIACVIKAASKKLAADNGFICKSCACSNN